MIYNLFLLFLLNNVSNYKIINRQTKLVKSSKFLLTAIEPASEMVDSDLSTTSSDQELVSAEQKNTKPKLVMSLVTHAKTIVRSKTRNWSCLLSLLFASILLSNVTIVHRLEHCSDSEIQQTDVQYHSLLLCTSNNSYLSRRCVGYVPLEVSVPPQDFLPTHELYNYYSTDGQLRTHVVEPYPELKIIPVCVMSLETSWGLLSLTHKQFSAFFHKQLNDLIEETHENRLNQVIVTQQILELEQERITYWDTIGQDQETSNQLNIQLQRLEQEDEQLFTQYFKNYNAHRPLVSQTKELQQWYQRYRWRDLAVSVALAKVAFNARAIIAEVIAFVQIVDAFWRFYTMNLVI